MSLYTKASGTKANIVVDASVPMESISTNFYHAFAQGGEEANDMIAPIAAETKALSPEIIRIDHIYDHFDVVSGSSGNLSYNFDKLDQIVNTIVSVGAKPLLALSFMPSVIAKMVQLLMCLIIGMIGLRWSNERLSTIAEKEKKYKWRLL